MPNQASNQYHLTKLYSFIGEEPGPVKEMVVIFLQSSTELLQDISTGLTLQDFEKISKAAHKLKPSLDIFGIDDMYDTIREIELNARNKTNPDLIKQRIDQLENRLKAAMLQMREDYSL